LNIEVGKSRIEDGQNEIIEQIFQLAERKVGFEKLRDFIILPEDVSVASEFSEKTKRIEKSVVAVLKDEIILDFGERAIQRIEREILNAKMIVWNGTIGYAEFEMVLNSPNKKSKKIGWFHTDVSYDNNKNRVMKRINLMKKFDWMIFGAKQTRQVIEDLYGVVYPKSSVIYNVIKLSESRNKANAFKVDYPIKPVFSSMGRLHSRKGYHTLAKVHKRLLNEGLEHSIAVIGGGNEMENLKNQCKELGIEKTFLLLNSQKNPWPYIKASDYFVLPSQSESYPLTIGEVMGLGKPIISTNVGGIPEMIENKVDGILVNYNENEIYEAMKQFLTDKNLVDRITQGTKNADEKFDENKIYQQISQVFENVLKK